MDQRCCAYSFLKETSRQCDYEVATDELASLIGQAVHCVKHQPELLKLCELVYHANGSIRGKLAIRPEDFRWLDQLYVKLTQENGELKQFVLPTGWSSKETTGVIREKLLEEGIDVASDDVKVVATGYGRVAVDFADYVITEITCHARGGREMAGDDCSIIDVGGQDTKVILVSGGMVQDFLMNDKCSAGTGKFLEIMANRLGVTLQELFDMADTGDVLSISSLCTVFAESEVINYIGEGKKREDIAAGVVDSVAAKVSQLAGRKNLADKVILTGGLSNSEYFTRILSEKLGKKVEMTENGRYAGAIGAALLAEEKSKRRR